MLAGARCGRLLSEARRVTISLYRGLYMYTVNRSWAWLSVRGARSLEHAHIVRKWLRSTNLTTKGAEKVSLPTGEAVIKRLWHRNALYKMELIYAKTKIRSWGSVEIHGEHWCLKKIAKWPVLASPGWDFYDSLSSRSWGFWIANQPRITFM